MVPVPLANPVVGALPPAAPRIASPWAVRALFAPLASARREMIVFAFLGPEWSLLGLRHSAVGSIDAVRLFPRTVVTDAIAFGATAVVMAHNHPSGDPTPSLADRRATALLARALDVIEVRLVEHLVVAAGGVSSFREMGWL